MGNEKILIDALIKTMAELIDYHDHNMGGHIDRIQKCLKIFYEEMDKQGVYREEIKKLDLDMLLQSCMLYDVGKVCIKDSILNKPGRLTNEEFSEMKKHVIYGETIIEKIEKKAGKSEFLELALIFTGTHHEKWDGSGYPRGLEGEEIPLLGRIMARIDVYDALTSVRPYKDALTHEQAVEIITETSGNMFDPALVEVFSKVSASFKS
jgi:putative two-component system response regulator